MAALPEHAARPDKAARTVDRGPAEKVDVCHRSSGGREFHLINISGNALEAHVDHGDVLPGAAVPEMANHEYGGDCEIRSTQVVEGSFSGNGLSVGFTAYVASDSTVSGIGAYSFLSNGNIGHMAVSDLCLHPGAGDATVWGPGTLGPTPGPLADGYWVLTLIDEGASMSTRALCESSVSLVV